MKNQEALIKPIITTEEYENTLNLIRTLWDSPLGTTDTAMLERLCIAVDEYELKLPACSMAMPKK